MEPFDDLEPLVFVLAMAVRISRTAIINALRAFRGNVAAAAEHLKIRRKNLYERIRRERIRLSDFRQRRRTGHFSDPYTGQFRNPYDPSATGHDAENFDPYTKTAEMPMLPSMKTDLDPEVDIVRSRNVRVPPRLAEGLKWLRLELWKARGVEYDETAILEHFGARYFNDYATALLRDIEEKDSDKPHKG